MGFYPATGNESIAGSLAVSGSATISGTVNGVTIPVQDPWLPSDNTLLASSGDLDAYLGTFAAMAANVLYLCKVMIRQAMTAGHTTVGVEAAGSGTSSGTYTGVYSSSGVLLSGSSDISADLAADTVPLLPLTSAVALAAGTFVWVALVADYATTQPSLWRNGGASTVAASNAGLTAATLRYAVNGTTLASTITPASNTQTGAFPFWAGLAA